MADAFQAVTSRWDADDLDATFAGGLWADQAPSGTAYPFVRMTDLGESSQGRTSDSEYLEQGIQFSIFYKDAEDGDTDPRGAVKTLLAALDASVVRAAVTNGLKVERRRRAIRLDPGGESLWIGESDWYFRFGAPVNEGRG